jgi:hypothetical protein
MSINLEKNVITTIYKQRDENIVANLSLYNPPNSGKPIEVSLEKLIIKRMSVYKLTIARFKVPLFNIFASFDLRNLLFQVTFRVAGVNYTNSQTIVNTIYSISEFITVLNNIIKNAYNLTGLPTNTPPYMIYHEDRFCLVVPTQLMAGNSTMIVSPDLYYGIGGFPSRTSSILPGQYEIYLNQAIYYLSPIYDVNGAPVISSASGLIQYNSYMLRSEFHIQAQDSMMSRMLL